MEANLPARLADGNVARRSKRRKCPLTSEAVKVSREPHPTLPPPPQPPRTKLPPSPLDSERFLRYLLGIVVTVGALLVAVSLATIFLA